MEESFSGKETLPPIPQVKTVIVINNFIANTTSFLNLFAQVCESKLSAVSQRLSDIELTLSLLEAKLDSVPGIADVVAAARPEDKTLAPHEDQSSSIVDPPPPEPEDAEITSPADEPADVDDSLIPIRLHPDYEAYFRLQKLGVPEPQIRLKMQAEGVDPDALHDAEKLVPRPQSADDLPP